MIKKLIHHRLVGDGYLIATLAAMMIYILVVGQWAVNRFYSFNATLWDLGIMIQAIWNTGQGYILNESVNLGFPISRLIAAHWELIYLLIAIMFRMVPSVPMLLCLQTIILAAGAYPLYRIASKKLESRPAAFLIAVSYLLYPAMHGPNLFDLHSLTFATTFLIFTFYYIENDKPGPALAFVVLSLLCREDVSIVVIMLGIYLLFFRKNYRLGMIFIVLALAILVAYTNRPAYLEQPEILSGKGVSSLWSHLNSDGGSASIPAALFKRPLYVIGYIFRAENIMFLIKLFFPVLFLCFMSPSMFMICSPTLLLYLLSDWGPMHQIEYQYPSTLTPFIFLATIAGINNLRNRFGDHRTIYKNVPIILTSVIVIASLTATLTYSILRYHGSWRPSEMQRSTARKLEDIPASYSISTTARLGPHVAMRRFLYHFPYHWDEADLLLIGTNNPKIEMKNFQDKFPTKKVSTWNESTRKAFADPKRDLSFVIDHVFCLKFHQNEEDHFYHYFFRDSMAVERRYRTDIKIQEGLRLTGVQPVYRDAEQHHYLFTFENNQKYTRNDSLIFFLSFGDQLFPVDHQPHFGRFTMADWPIGQSIVDHVFIDKPDGIHETEFLLYIARSGSLTEMVPVRNGTFE
ncbi:DUF2079 domain-containing protein [candidate division KSB1 bacterium]|nr:DUF2079 domain-containing protein [candidate division KSB1 bacterium]